VNSEILIRKRGRRTKKFLKILGIVILILVILIGVYLAGFFAKKPESRIVLENPLKDIVFANTNEFGVVNRRVVVEAGILGFDAEYINYILVALGVGNLHGSIIYGNPVIEFVLDEEAWNAEIDDGVLKTGSGGVEEEDLRILISKEEAVNAILSPEIGQFMKDSVASGNTQIEMVAGKAELFTKGYLGMYKDITGEEADIEE